MTCTCEHRGYCPVLQIHTTEHIRRLCCKDQGKARRIADAMRTKAPAIKQQAVEGRRQRVRLAVEKKQRLISWLQFFRLDTDRGVGDTANRINSRTGPRRELHLMLESLLKQCSCSRRDAVAKLNSDWPY